MYENSRILFDRATKVIPGGVNSPVRFFKPFPFFAASSNGSKVTSSDHVSYVDYCMGYGSLLLGHANTKYWKPSSCSSIVDLSTVFPQKRRLYSGR